MVHMISVYVNSIEIFSATLNFLCPRFHSFFYFMGQTSFTSQIRHTARYVPMEGIWVQVKVTHKHKPIHNKENFEHIQSSP